MFDLELICRVWFIFVKQQEGFKLKKKKRQSRHYFSCIKKITWINFILGFSIILTFSQFHPHPLPDLIIRQYDQDAWCLFYMSE